MAQAGDEYFQLRDGLGNCRVKFETAKTGRVAFLGGSITQMSGWRELVMEHLRQKFPQTRFDFIGAGIGSLGSVPHSFRLNRDVLSSGTVDLLFVEAAVNDASNIPDQPTQMLRGMEGVVRHFRLANPEGDIVQMHFVMPEHMTAYKQGRVPVAIAQHEKVAEAYGNPSLDLAREVTDRIKAGEFTWKDDFKDLHPAPFGMNLYAKSIARMLDAAWSKPAGPVQKRRMPEEPLDAKSYFRGRFGKLEDAKIIQGFKQVAKWTPHGTAKTRPGYVNVPALTASEPGAEFEFAFEGTGVGLMIGAGPDTGIIEVRCDNGPVRRIDTFTIWSAHLYLPWAVILDDNLAPGRHTVRVRLTGERNPKSAGTALHVFQLLEN